MNVKLEHVLVTVGPLICFHRAAKLARAHSKWKHAPTLSNTYPRTPRSSLPVALMAILLLLPASCGESDQRPDLLPLRPASVAVGDTLRLALHVNNPSGLKLSYEVTPPEGMPAFESVSSLVGTPEGGEFLWTPLSSHEGPHELTFTIRSSAGDDSEAVVVTVTANEAAAPIFLRPGAGGTFDTSKTPCVRFAVEVKDDDSSEVAIRPARPLPDGALLEREGPKRARFKWCPTSAQSERTQRWTIAMEADDGEHEPTRHDYVVVLRTPARAGCPGHAPTVGVLSPGDGQVVESSAGYPVLISATDDKGIREAPLLYYTTEEPPSLTTVDVTTMKQVLFEPAADGAPDHYRAQVPPLALDPTEQRTVWFFVSVTDNDDESGTLCDHRTDTPVLSFLARLAFEKAKQCELCTASATCQSGLCVAWRDGGRCFGRCSGCPPSVCHSVTSVEGRATGACGDLATACGLQKEDPEPGGPDGESCLTDAHEPNDTPDLATPLLSAPATEAGLGGTVCPNDEDLYRVSTDEDSRVDVTVGEFEVDHDLDIELLDAAGEVLVRSASLEMPETASVCLKAGHEIFIRVFPFISSSGTPYRVDVMRAPEACCVNDEHEPDNVLETARAPAEDGTFEGTICPHDRDYIRVVAPVEQTMKATLAFEGEGDLDLILEGPNGVLSMAAGSGTSETLFFLLPEPGTYGLVVQPFGDFAADYAGRVVLGIDAGCSRTGDCPTKMVCNEGSCQIDICDPDLACPSGHSCAATGMPLAGKHQLCLADCLTDFDCRNTQGYRCKWLVEGRRCAVAGTAQAGEGCDDFEDCAGDLGCAMEWPHGTCTRIGCVNNLDCGPDAFCMNDPYTPGRTACLRRCGDGFPACRVAESYSCVSTIDRDQNLQTGCLPPIFDF